MQWHVFNIDCLGQALALALVLAIILVQVLALVQYTRRNCSRVDQWP